MAAVDPVISVSFSTSTTYILHLTCDTYGVTCKLYSEGKVSESTVCYQHATDNAPYYNNTAINLTTYVSSGPQLYNLSLYRLFDWDWMAWWESGYSHKFRSQIVTYTFQRYISNGPISRYDFPSQLIWTSKNGDYSFNCSVDYPSSGSKITVQDVNARANSLSTNRATASIQSTVNGYKRVVSSGSSISSSQINLITYTYSLSTINQYRDTSQYDNADCKGSYPYPW